MQQLIVRIVANEHGGYTGVCPNLPGCMSRGATADEARRKLEEAITGYFAAVTNFVPEDPHRLFELVNEA
jgi:predicted RNase H-like HicB family nuclease